MYNKVKLQFRENISLHEFRRHELEVFALVLFLFSLRDMEKIELV